MFLLMAEIIDTLVEKVTIGAFNDGLLVCFRECYWVPKTFSCLVADGVHDVIDGNIVLGDPLWNFDADDLHPDVEVEEVGNEMLWVMLDYWRVVLEKDGAFERFEARLCDVGIEHMVDL